MSAASMSEPLAVREAPASYQVVLDAQRVRPGYSCPPGYKQTEVGVIPEDWEIMTLAGVVAIDPDNLGSNTQPDFAFNYISLEDVNVGTLTGYSEQVFRTAPSRARRKLRKDDILVATVRPNLKSHLLFSIDRQDWVCSTGFSVARCKVQVTNPGYIYSHLFGDCVSRQIESLLTGSNYPSINSSDVRALKIPLPPTLAEQEAIAGALSDADALIEALEQLIAKKRHLKQGAMQQLLTGKKRLPGFSGKWVVKQLGDVTEIKKGQLITEKDAVSGNVPVIAGGKKPAYFHNRANRIGKVITVSASGASAGYVAFFDEPIFASDCSTISEGKSYSVEFIYYQLQLSQEIIYKAQTGGAQPHIHAVDLIPLEIGCPVLEEQTAIATILSDMDTEIAALETRLAKTRSLKQGMMHNLLTGKIRLV